MSFVQPYKWGKDHVSLLAYIETCCVDKCPDKMNPVPVRTDGTRGQVSYVRMRVNERRHPMHKVTTATGSIHRWKP